MVYECFDEKTSSSCVKQIKQNEKLAEEFYEPIKGYSFER